MKRTHLAAAALTAAALALTGCSAPGGDASSDDKKEPIPVGAVSSLSGPSTFPEATQAAQAVFDRFNEAGGLDGRKIQYTVVDDKGDPGAASTAARDVVGEKDVIALVGSSSLLECAINAKYYEQEKVASIEAVATGPECFTSPNIAPTTVGPYGNTELALRYGSEVLGLERMCAIIETAGSTAPAYDAAVDRWSEDTGKELAFYDSSLPYGLADYTPYVVKGMSQNCDGVFLGLIEPDALGFLKAANAQGWNSVPFLSLTTVYTDSFAKAADGLVGKGLYVPAEFAPYTDPASAATKDWRELMTEKGIPLTSFGQAGYIAANVFIDALKTIKGDVTRATFLDAVKSMKPVVDPMIGSPWKWGNTPNRSGWPVKLLPGSSEWQLAADDWIRLDD